MLTVPSLSQIGSTPNMSSQLMFFRICWKNIHCELILGVEQICDWGGMVSLTLLEKHDPMFALYARQGLMWSVLSSAINEDPEALDVIQAAANCKNSMAMVPHEMECIAKVRPYAPSHLRWLS